MDVVTLIFIIVILVFSTVLHEMAHGYVAYWLGDHTAKAMGRLSLNPIVHIDPVMSIIIPVMLYMMGGPVFGGSFLFFLAWFFIGGNVGNGNPILLYGMQINMGFALFNILPIPPLDGSRVLYALAPDFARDFMRKIEPIGIFIVYILVFFVGSWFSEDMINAETGLLKGYLWLVGVR